MCEVRKRSRLSTQRIIKRESCDRNHKKISPQRDSRTTKQGNVQWKVRMGPQHNVLCWRIQPVPFVGRKLMNRGIGFLPRLRMWNETDPDGSSRLTITSGRTKGNQPACLKKSGMSFSVVTSQHTCVSVDRSPLACRRPR